MASVTHSLSSGGNGKLVSTHGRALLMELLDPATADQERVLELIRKDRYAGRMKDADSGDNAFHLLLGSGYSKAFLMPIMNLLLAVCPEGLQTKNHQHQLPLHLSLSRHQLIPELTLQIIAAYPAAAEVKNAQGLLPLFLCVMRDDATTELCRAICRAYPSGVSTANKSSRSLPLHYAAKHAHPNREILTILLRRYPEGASKVNNFGATPLHCLASASDDVESAQLLVDRCPEAVRLQDNHGRTCLHLAVLAVGKEHTAAIVKEEEELILERERELSRKGQLELSRLGSSDESTVDRTDDDFDDDSEDEDDDGGGGKNSKASLRSYCTRMELKERQDTKTRDLVRYLVDAFPAALTISNNFFYTPLQTVLEKTRSVRTNKKVVTVFGLADDPPTARILLLGQLRYSSLPPSFSILLRELNWLSRKDALWASLVGEPRVGSKEAAFLRAIRQYCISGTTDVKMNTSEMETALTALGFGKPQKGANNVRNGKKKSSSSPDDVNTVKLLGALDQSLVKRINALYTEESAIPLENILARLRRRGLVDTVRLVIAFV